MARKPRYLWGVTKVKVLQFAPSTGQGAAGKRKGMIYFNSDNTFRFCEDGTHFQMIHDALSSSSSSKSSSSSSTSSA